MRLVLGTAEQTFTTIDLEGMMEPGRASIIAAWLKSEHRSRCFADYLAADARAAVWLQEGLDVIRQMLMPVEAALERLPHHVALGERLVRLDYAPLGGLPGGANAGGRPAKLLVILTDVTGSDLSSLGPDASPR